MIYDDIQADRFDDMRRELVGCRWTREQAAELTTLIEQGAACVAPVSVSIPKMMPQITLQARITGQRGAAIRIWLGCKLMMLAAMVMGTGIEIDHSA